VLVVVMTFAVALFRIVTLAPPTTAPVGSVTVPTMLPVLMVVCANTTEGLSSSASVAKIKKLNRVAKRRGEFCFDIVHLPFQMFTKFLVIQNSLGRNSQQNGSSTVQSTSK